MLVPLLRLALLFVLIPNVSFSLTDLDTQPYAAIIGIVCILFALKSTFPVKIWCLLVPAIASFLIAMNSTSFMVGARAFTIYISPWIFACVAYLAVNKKIDFSKYIISMIYIWAVVGLLQWNFGPNIFEILVNYRTSEIRGVTGLTPEPSFYGLAIIQMWLTLLMINPKFAKKGHIIVICIFQIIVLSQSTLAILILSALVTIFTIRSKIYLFSVVNIMIGIILIIFIMDYQFVSSSRFFVIIEKFLSSPSDILYLDASISERFYHIFLSLKYSILSGLSPHGFDSFEENIKIGQNDYDSFWWGAIHNKINSGVGGALFELGWFSIIYFIVFYSYLNLYKFISRFDKFVIGIGVFLVLLTSVTFAAPLIGMMIGFMAAGKKNQVFYLL